ncbi:MAG: ABC transporter ATP-binding protein [Anaerolineae bacterium]|nr:ABC transporter ATP-binding protein [Anaerolineae bacterium]
MPAIITITDLAKTYYVKERAGFLKSRIREINALKNINLNIEQGELFGLLGPNGAGKTTLIKCITTLLIPTRGRIVVNDFVVGRQDVQVRASLGCLLGGERSIYWKLTGRENLEYFAALYYLSPAQTKAQLKKLGHLLHLESLLDRPVETYSSGQKMALVFARALINNARILILDEPTTALDVPSAQALRRIIKTLNSEGYTIILTSHQMTEVEELCQRVAIVDQGVVIAEGTIEALKHDLGQNQIIKMEGVIPPAALEAVKRQNDVIKVVASQSNRLTQLTVFVEDMRQTLPGLMQNLLNHQALLEHISPATITLEDVFMAKTGRALSEDTPL